MQPCPHCKELGMYPWPQDTKYVTARGCQICGHIEEKEEPVNVRHN